MNAYRPMLAVAGLVLLAASAAAPAEGAKLKGRVQESSSRRLVRPASIADPSGVVSSRGLVGGAGLRDDAFELKASSMSLNGQAGFPELGSGAADDHLSFASEGARQCENGRVQGAVIDYAAIENAYGALARQAIAVANAAAAQSAGTGGVPAGFGVGRNGLASAAPAGGAPTVDYDNCLCGTQMPSPHCMAERTSAIYGGMYGGPHVGTPAVPGRPTISMPAGGLHATAVQHVSGGMRLGFR